MHSKKPVQSGDNNSRPDPSDIKARPDFTEKRLDSKKLYAGQIINVSIDRVLLPNGKETVREVARHSGVAAIVPLLDDNTLLLEWQYRYPLGRHILEIPAGKLDGDESSRDAAERELLEETGYRAGKWTEMLTMSTTPGFCDEEAVLYLAEDLHYEGHAGEDDEFVSVEITPIETALTWLNEGKITDAKTIIALLWLERRRRC